MQTISDAINRGKNLLATSIVGLAGVSFLPEAFLEKDLGDKLDDAALFMLGIIAVIWYLVKGNSYKRSLVPPILVTIGLIIKIVGLIVEFGDPDSVGDDFGGLILFIAATILVWVQYFKKDGQGAAV